MPRVYISVPERLTGQLRLPLIASIALFLQDHGTFASCGFSTCPVAACGAGLTIKPLSCVALRQVRLGRQRRAVGVHVRICLCPSRRWLARSSCWMPRSRSPDFIYLGTLQNVETRSVGAAVTPSVAVSVAVVCCDVLLLQQLLLLLLLPVLVVVVVVVVGRA